jgi:hypothetical protein
MDFITGVYPFEKTAPAFQDRGAAPIEFAEILIDLKTWHLFRNNSAAWNTDQA